MKIVISSGHGKYIRGAEGYLDEVDEARRVVETVAAILNTGGVNVTTFHDNVSTSQDENLERIVDFHNSRDRELDVSVHFNDYEDTTKPMGTECWYETQEELSANVSAQIAAATRLPDRGAKDAEGGLYFLNHTEMPAILIEVCFVCSTADAKAYNDNYDRVCQRIASALAGHEMRPPTERPPRPDRPPSGEPLFYAKGPCSWFGGPKDTGVSPSEGLAMYSSIDQAPWLFLPIQPSGTTGLARRLNPAVPFIACRWDYEVTPKNMLRQGLAMVRANGISLKTFIGDWGPHEDTGRVADLSKVLMDNLGLETDDEVEVFFPYEAGE